MKKDSKKHSGTTRPALYFVFLIIFIIIVSAAFKTYDLFKKSKYDGDNRFTVAVISKKESNILTVSPKDKTISQITFKNVNDEKSLLENSVPLDGFVKTEIKSENPKDYFSKLFSAYRDVKTDLTIIDLFRLKMFASGVENGNVKKEVIEGYSDKNFNSLTQTSFIDPKIAEEKVTIQITNATPIGGLGAILAKYLTNLGANVVLVNSSQADENNTKIYYKNESYTLEKISKILKVDPTEKDVNSISDINIIIGSDREDLFE
ncbi:LytR family transcriptional regulator [Candidatus Dojkabacteria bacterium]|uniref:LytR family transcriptional regulator n=1 Tax=Candidatus Dojkabacteria bacterium TaxID=2099670 RepID=A0A5C7J2L1_9BACT|nr:MAG: LytR family transcriptional regulator [Candidatus Dojkabacteria bacterium]